MFAPIAMVVDHDLCVFVRSIECNAHARWRRLLSSSTNLRTVNKINANVLLSLLLQTSPPGGPSTILLSRSRSQQETRGTKFCQDSTPHQ